MKKVTPRQDYDGDAGYPGTSELRFTRRGFLGRAAAATVAAVSGAVAVSAQEAGAAPAPRRAGSARQPVEPTRIRIDLPYQSPVNGSDLRPERVEVFVTDKELVRFFGKSEERAGLQQAVTKVTTKATAAEFYDGRRLYQLEQRIARSVEAHVRKRTKRSFPPLDLMLHVGQGYRIHTGGVMIRPRPPVVPHIRRP